MGIISAQSFVENKNRMSNLLGNVGKYYTSFCDVYTTRALQFVFLHTSERIHPLLPLHIKCGDPMLQMVHICCLLLAYKELQLAPKKKAMGHKSGEIGGQSCDPVLPI